MVFDAITKRKLKNLPGMVMKMPFKIVNMHKYPDPEKRMDRIFNILIDWALDEAEKEFGTRPRSFSMRIDSPAYTLGLFLNVKVPIFNFNFKVPY